MPPSTTITPNQLVAILTDPETDPTLASMLPVVDLAAAVQTAKDQRIEVVSDIEDAQFFVSSAVTQTFEAKAEIARGLVLTSDEYDLLTEAHMDALEEAGIPITIDEDSPDLGMTIDELVDAALARRIVLDETVAALGETRQDFTGQVYAATDELVRLEQLIDLDASGTIVP